MGEEPVSSWERIRLWFRGIISPVLCFLDFHAMCLTEGPRIQNGVAEKWYRCRYCDYVEVNAYPVSREEVEELIELYRGTGPVGREMIRKLRRDNACLWE